MPYLLLSIVVRIRERHVLVQTLILRVKRVPSEILPLVMGS